MTLMTEEAIAVTCAAGVRLPEGVVEAVEAGGHHEPSHLVDGPDIAAEAAPEIDSLNGYVVSWARSSAWHARQPDMHGLVKLRRITKM
jgi:ketopantoate reductase